jgi:hypothetical protein
LSGGGLLALSHFFLQYAIYISVGQEHKSLASIKAATLNNNKKRHPEEALVERWYIFTP